GLAIELPGAALALLEDVRRNARLAHAAEAICHRLGTDGRIDGPLPHFRWSLQVADRRLRVAMMIARYVAGPAIADLATLPPEGLADISLRLRAVRRRLATNFRAA